MNIKELRQASTDLQREQSDLKRQARAILNVSAERLTDEQEATYQTIESRLTSIDERMVEVGAAMQRWERAWEEERNEPAARLGQTDLLVPSPLPTVLPTPKLYGSFGEQLQAIYRAGIGQGTDDRLLKISAAALGAGESAGELGGFLVQTDFSTEILRKMFATGQLLQRVRRFPISAGANGITIPALKESSRVAGSRYGGVQGYWVDEGTAPTATNVKFRKIELKLRKVMALGYATDELMADAVALGAIMTDAFASELQFLVEDSFINGTGAGQPLGIMNSAARVDVAIETGQAAATVLAENIMKMWTRFWASSRVNAVWFINQDIEQQLLSMALPVGTGGIPVYMPANGLSGAPFATLMGRPVIPVEYCATLGTNGDIILADLGEYVFIDKGGVEQASSIHVRFTTGENTFRATYRADGQPIWDAALTPFKGTNTLSPYVALATR